MNFRWKQMVNIPHLFEVPPNRVHFKTTNHIVGFSALILSSHLFHLIFIPMKSVALLTPAEPFKTHILTKYDKTLCASASFDHRCSHGVVKKTLLAFHAVWPAFPSRLVSSTRQGKSWPCGNSFKLKPHSAEII